MHIIAHRINTIEELISTPRKYGIEVDIRSHGDRIVIHHDPFIEGVDFNAWMDAYNHGTLILNVKEEGLEATLIAAMKDRGIDDYFFLDQSFPFLVKWSKQGVHRCAVRVSEFESIDTALTLAGGVNWVWVDCFSHLALTRDDADKLHDAGFKLCLVSPELQGRTDPAEIHTIQNYLSDQDIRFQAVCTKRPDLWE
jgi:hypothetical protein